MKKNVKNIGIILIFLVCLFAVPLIVFSEDYVAHFDKFFENKEFVINTNEIYEENTTGLYSLVNYHTSRYYVFESGTYNGDYTSLRLHLSSCDYDSMKCNITLLRDTRFNNSFSTNSVKNYENISIIINEENDYFDFVNEDNKIEINYDESMFLNDTEKNEYISNYIARKSHSFGEGNRSTYSFFRDDLTLTRTDSVVSTGELLLYAKRVVSGVEFNYIETPYSDEFKKLTSGTITIKTNDGESVNDDMLEMYLHGNLGSWDYSFSLDGGIRNNKAFIVMYENDHETGQSIAKERHLVNIVKDSNFDEELFERVGFNNLYVINADTPEEQYEYISSYFNSINYRGLSNNSDGSYSDYSVYVPYNTNIDKVYAIYKKYDRNYIQTDYQYYVIPLSFNGYKETFSEKFTSLIGRTITINSSIVDRNSITRSLSYEYPVLSCNDDYSICDIGLVDDKNKTVEIHKVNIVFNEEISNKFRTIINLNSDDELEILLDNGLEFNSSFSYYNDETGDFINYDCFGILKCEVSIDNYELKYFESHELLVKPIPSTPSEFFKTNIGLNRDMYVGETTHVWDNIAHSGIFSNDTNVKTRAFGCDETLKTCKVIVFNDNKKLEMHTVNVNVKTEKSPAYIKALSSDSLKMNAIYKDDDDFLYMMSTAYLLGKTKSWTYMTDFEANQAKVIFNNIEAHTVDIEYEESNPDYQEIINETIEELDNTDLKILSTDLEFVNIFYYREPGVNYSNNFNSKAFYDVMREIINNKHVGYFMVPELGDGSDYTSFDSGRIALYYDGVGYGATNNYFDVRKSNVIYIPNDTPDSIEEYVKAAQKRVDNYLGKNSGVKIVYNRTKDDSYIYRADEDDSFFEDYGIDKDKYDGNDYLIMHNGKVEHMLIIKDSSKMQNPGFVATDVRNNLTVSSDNANYPTNTIITSEVLDDSSERLKELLKNKGIENSHVVDINLFSTAVGDITDFEGKEFNVNVPLLDTEFDTDDLAAYYIDENGHVEEHAITMDDFIANFKTDHFSEYIILTRADGNLLKNSTINPKTFDNITSYLIVGLASLFMLVLSLMIKKRLN